MSSKTNSTWLSWAILLFLVLVWGSSFILMKKSLNYFSHQHLALLRISVTSVFLLPFAMASLKKVTLKKLGQMAIVGIVGNGIPAFLFAKAQTGIDSSFAGILNSITPLFTLLVGVAFFRLKTRWINIAGIFIALAGTTGLMSISGNHSLQFNFSYGVYIVLATLLYAINLNFIKNFLASTDAVTITSFAFLCIGIPAIVYLLAATDFVVVMKTHSGIWTGMGYIALLSVFGSGVAVILYNKLIKDSGVLFAASVTYMMPVVAAMWGIIDGELFEPVYLLWIGLILLGVFMVNQRSPKITA